MSSLYPSSASTGQVIATWLGILTIVGTAFAKFVSLDEAKEIARRQLTDHEQRVSAIERDQRAIERYHELSGKVDRLQWQLDQLQSERRAERKHGR